MRRWHAKEKGGEGGRGRGEGLAVGVLEAMEVVADELAAGGAEVDEVAAGSHGGDAAAPVARWPWIWAARPLAAFFRPHHWSTVAGSGRGEEGVGGAGSVPSRRGRSAACPRFCAP